MHNILLDYMDTYVSKESVDSQQYIFLTVVWILVLYQYAYSTVEYSKIPVQWVYLYYSVQ